MKIAILGANGRTGKVFLDECLKQGYQVRAGVYRNNDLEQNENLEVIQVDGTNVEQVDVFVGGVDAVVSLIGHVKGTPDWMQSDTITNVVNAMSKHGVKRLISLTGSGARMPNDTPSLIDRFLNFGVKTVDPSRVNDGVKHLEIIKASDLDWTVVRVLKLTNSDKIRDFALTTGGPAMIFNPRETVAKALMEVVQNGSFIREAPVISKHRKAA